MTEPDGGDNLSSVAMGGRLVSRWIGYGVVFMNAAVVAGRQIVA